ncbi:ABC transporter ATP-binding protein [Bosea sp. CCNWLW174]|uniref:ABC transporter ATP-binding protein n=1 Tax=unclassified Bosea (in: a-proteobacteria) TaxID=2653178 RepID=UPI00301584D5
MYSDIAVSVTGVGKCYLVYDRPQDRLKQALFGTLARLLGRPVPRYFREFWALRDVGFSIRRGETVGIIGRNGAGKSTLLEIICGTLAPTTGVVETHGRVAALLELGSGFNPEFTGRENIRLNASILGLSDGEIEERLPAIMEFAGLGDFIDQPVKTYSSGMAVRLAFAVMAHIDADILIIDEALAVGDAFFVQKCMRFLHEFTERGTLLFISHDTSAVVALCDRAIWLEKGEVIHDGEPKEVSDAYLAKIYESIGSGSGSAAAQPPTDAEEADGASVAAHAETEATIPASATSFGAGGASVRSVRLLDQNGIALLAIEGGERVTLAITAALDLALQNPIIGFVIRDRMGQKLFSDNTFLSFGNGMIPAGPGTLLQANFEFDMPYLLAGDYSVSATVADGTQQSHVMHHWVNDALVFKSLQPHGHRGMVGLTSMVMTIERL